MAIKTHNPLDIDILSRPIAGQSLTDTPGSKPYEKPPQVTSPQQAFDVVVASLEEPAATRTIINLLDAGISSETLASAVTLKMFSEGVFTPDVAEIIKPPLTAFITDIGVDGGVEGVKVVNEIPDDGMNEGDSLEMMSKLNPQKFEASMGQTTQEDEFEEMLLEMDIPEGEEPSRESFLDMEGI